MNKCVRCGNNIELERLSVLPETNYCINCAKIVQPKRLKGIMIFDNKMDSAPEICIVSHEQFEKQMAQTTAYIDDLSSTTVEEL